MNIAQHLIELAFNIKNNTIVSPDGYLAFMDEFMQEEVIDNLSFNADLTTRINEFIINENRILIEIMCEDQEGELFEIYVSIKTDGTPARAEVMYGEDWIEEVKF
jgi:hypothetical protein